MPNSTPQPDIKPMRKEAWLDSIEIQNKTTKITKITKIKITTTKITKIKCWLEQ